jgi:hypothetical protein
VRPVQGAVRQYVFYSVAPGQRAVQVGTGIWTKTLLDALEGRSYQPVARHGRSYEVSLSHLARWVRGEVSRRIGKTFLRDAAKFVQTPEYVPDPAGDDPVLVTYTDQTVPRARIDVYIEPDVALRTCRVSVKQYVDGLGEEIEVAAGPAPPICPPLQFNLRPADYSIQAQADDYVLASQPWTLEDEPLVELTLQATRAVGPGSDSGLVGVANLLNLFPGLPDAWVLAGLCDPERRGSWFEQAGRCGVPLFAQGLRAMEPAGDPRTAASEAFAGLLPGSSWTAWTVTPRASRPG